jgi:hypothetical protein
MLYDVPLIPDLVGRAGTRVGKARPRFIMCCDAVTPPCNKITLGPAAQTPITDPDALGLAAEPLTSERAACDF